jgi:hypothetical protein
MRYREISNGDCLPLAASHPFRVQLAIDPTHWHDFQRLNADNPAVRVLGHEANRSGLMTLSIACASHEVLTRLKDRWL